MVDDISVYISHEMLQCNAIRCPYRDRDRSRWGLRCGFQMEDGGMTGGREGRKEFFFGLGVGTVLI